MYRKIDKYKIVPPIQSRRQRLNNKAYAILVYA